MSDSLHVLVDRGDITRTRIDQTPTLEPAMGDILVRVNRLAVTSNNVTYAVMADRIPYFDFFPAPDGWARVPAWGFGDVAASNAPGIEVGERLFGFWPMSTHLVLHPERISEHSFFDGSEHRSRLPAVYNAYSRVTSDPGYVAHEESRIALLRPLFLTAFALSRHLAGNDYYQADQIIVSSASAKTALLAAFLLHRRAAPPLVGLTSPGHVEFVVGTGLYDRVLTYPQVADLADRPSLYLDFAGEPAVRTELRRLLGPHLRHDVAAGFTHWQTSEPAVAWEGAEPTFFFTPAHVVRMIQEDGPSRFWEEYGRAWEDFRPAGEDLIRISERNRIEALAQAYRDFATGEADLTVGVVVRF